MTKFRQTYNLRPVRFWERDSFRDATRAIGLGIGYALGFFMFYVLIVAMMAAD